MEEHQTEMNKIFNENDYEAWQNKMNVKADDMAEKFNGMKENINEEQFSKMSEIHNLMQEGKIEEAKALKEEMGMEFGHKMGAGMMKMKRMIGKK
ncbi:hypothetical protein D4R87_01250 [bacterium]|nr:MAG: hypothetical protein D4R87_01250 [bacterium]